MALFHCATIVLCSSSLFTALYNDIIIAHSFPIEYRIYYYLRIDIPLCLQPRGILHTSVLGSNNSMGACAIIISLSIVRLDVCAS